MWMATVIFFVSFMAFFGHEEKRDPGIIYRHLIVVSEEMDPDPTTTETQEEEEMVARL